MLISGPSSLVWNYMGPDLDPNVSGVDVLQKHTQKLMGFKISIQTL